MRLIIFALAFVFSGPAFACRNVIDHKVLSSEEALKQATLVLSGSIVKHERVQKTGDFRHFYEFKVDRVWKGALAQSSFNFVMEHHTCAQYPEEFPTAGGAKSGPTFLYFGQKNKQGEWRPIRIVNIYSNQKKSSDAETDFLSRSK